MESSLLALVVLAAFLGVISTILIAQQVRRERREADDCDRAQREAMTWRIGASVLYHQIEGEGIRPHWQMPPNGEPPRQDRIVTALVRYFSMEDLEALAYDIGVQWEGLGGEGLALRAIRLVEYAKRRGLEHDLVAAIKRARPNVEI